jgi:hypothetical protein
MVSWWTTTRRTTTNNQLSTHSSHVQPPFSGGIALLIGW